MDEFKEEFYRACGRALGRTDPPGVVQHNFAWGGPWFVWRIAKALPARDAQAALEVSESCSFVFPKEGNNDPAFYKLDVFITGMAARKSGHVHSFTFDLEKEEDLTRLACPLLPFLRTLPDPSNLLITMAKVRIDKPIAALHREVINAVLTPVEHQEMHTDIEGYDESIIARLKEADVHVPEEYETVDLKIVPEEEVKEAYDRWVARGYPNMDHGYSRDNYAIFARTFKTESGPSTSFTDTVEVSITLSSAVRIDVFLYPMNRKLVATVDAYETPVDPEPMLRALFTYAREKRFPATITDILKNAVSSTWADWIALWQPVPHEELHGDYGGYDESTGLKEAMPKEGKVSDYLDSHPVLTKYPWAKEIRVTIHPDMTPMGRFIAGDTPEESEIQLKDPSYLRTLGHELIHLRQEVEGKPGGGSATTMWTGNRRAETLAFARKLYQQMKTPRSLEDYAKAAGFDSPEEARESYTKDYLPGFKGKKNLDRLWLLAQQGAGEQLYRALPGEAEARGDYSAYNENAGNLSEIRKKTVYAPPRPGAGPSNLTAKREPRDEIHREDYNSVEFSILPYEIKIGRATIAAAFVRFSAKCFPQAESENPYEDENAVKPLDGPPFYALQITLGARDARYNAINANIKRYFDASGTLCWTKKRNDLTSPLVFCPMGDLRHMEDRAFGSTHPASAGHFLALASGSVSDLIGTEEVKMNLWKFFNPIVRVLAARPEVRELELPFARVEHEELHTDTSGYDEGRL